MHFGKKMDISLLPYWFSSTRVGQGIKLSMRCHYISETAADYNNKKLLLN